MDAFWNLYWDFKYPITVIFCFGVGFLAGYWEAKIQDRVKKANESK